MYSWAGTAMSGRDSYERWFSACMAIYRSKLHATLKRNYQLMTALKWLRLLMNHFPDNGAYPGRYLYTFSASLRAAGQARVPVP